MILKMQRTEKKIILSKQEGTAGVALQINVEATGVN